MIKVWWNTNNYLQSSTLACSPKTKLCLSLIILISQSTSDIEKHYWTEKNAL